MGNISIDGSTAAPLEPESKEKTKSSVEKKVEATFQQQSSSLEGSTPTIAFTKQIVKHSSDTTRAEPIEEIAAKKIDTSPPAEKALKKMQKAVALLAQEGLTPKAIAKFDKAQDVASFEKVMATQALVSPVKETLEQLLSCYKKNPVQDSFTLQEFLQLKDELQPLLAADDLASVDLELEQASFDTGIPKREILSYQLELFRPQIGKGISQEVFDACEKYCVEGAPQVKLSKSTQDIIQLFEKPPTTREEFTQAIASLQVSLQASSWQDLSTELEIFIKLKSKELAADLIDKLDSLISALKDPPINTHNAEQASAWLRICLQEVSQPPYLEPLKIGISSEVNHAVQSRGIKALEVLATRCKENDLLLADMVAILRDQLDSSTPAWGFLNRAYTQLQCQAFLNFTFMQAFDTELQSAIEKGDFAKMLQLQSRLGASGQMFLNILDQHIELLNTTPNPTTTMKETLNILQKALDLEMPNFVFESRFKEFVEMEKLYISSANGLIDAIKSSDSTLVSCEILIAISHSLDIHELCQHLIEQGDQLPLVQQRSINSYVAQINKAIDENRRIQPEFVLNRLLSKEIAAENFRQSFHKIVRENQSGESLQMAIVDARIDHTPVFFIMKREIDTITDPIAKARAITLYNRAQENYEADVSEKFAKLFTSMSAKQTISTKELHELIDDAQANGLFVTAQLEKVLETLKEQGAAAESISFCQRIIQNLRSLLAVPYGIHKLNPYELLRITCIAEYKLLYALTTERIKATDPDIQLSRSLLLDPKNRSFAIILGSHGQVQAKGGEGKVRSVITVADEAIHDVRKTPLKKAGLPRVFNEREIKYCKMFMKLGMIVDYTQGGKLKQSINMEQFSTDYKQLLAKGKDAFDNSAEMLDAFDQLLATLEAMHTHVDEKGLLSPIVHGDVKPANIMYRKGKTQLADFGFAAEVLKEPSRLTRHATKAYCSPEDLLRTKIVLTPEERMAIDMFGVGQVLGLYISVCEQQDGKGKELWKQNGDAPWMEKLENHFVKKIPQDITEDINLVRLRLVKSNHPLAELAIWLLDPNPEKRLTVTQAREMIQDLRKTSAPPPPKPVAINESWKELANDLKNINEMVLEHDLPASCEVLYKDFYPLLQDPKSDFNTLSIALVERVQKLPLASDERLYLFKMCPNLCRLVESLLLLK